jgi:hypothetical protein
MGERSTASIGIDGVTYSGWYETARVHTPYGSKSAQIFGTPPDVMAHMLLRGLVTTRAEPEGLLDSKRRVRTREPRGQPRDVAE